MNDILKLKMNSRDRVYAVLEGRPCDRVPLCELIIDKKTIKKINPGWDYADLAEEMVDIVVTNTPSLMYRKEILDSSKGIFKNEWGIIRQESDQSVSMPVSGPIKNREDLRHYKAPDPYDEYRYSELNYLLERFRGRKAVGIHLHDVFNYPYYLRGMENFLMDLATDKYMCARLIDLSVDHNLAIALKAIKMGADFVLLGDDYGMTTGPIFSPATFEKLMLPGFKTIVSEIKRAKGFVIKHCCGNINSLLDMLADSGIDILHPLDKTAGMNISEVQDKYMDRFVVMGGIDCGDLLTNKKVDEVIEITKQLLKDVSSKGRHIVSSSNTIHPRVKPENYIAMVDTVKKFGKYPILINWY